MSMYRLLLSLNGQTALVPHTRGNFPDKVENLERHRVGASPDTSIPPGDKITDFLKQNKKRNGLLYDAQIEGQKVGSGGGGT